MWIEPDLALITLTRVLESWRHHADERDRFAAKREGGADRVRGAAEPSLPEIVADDRNARRACAPILRLKDAPALRRNAEQRKEIGRNNHSIELFWFSLPRQGEGHRLIGRHFG